MLVLLILSSGGSMRFLDVWKTIAFVLDAFNDNLLRASHSVTLTISLFRVNELGMKQFGSGYISEIKRVVSSA